MLFKSRFGLTRNFWSATLNFYENMYPYRDPKKRGKTKEPPKKGSNNRGTNKIISFVHSFKTVCLSQSVCLSVVTSRRRITPFVLLCCAMDRGSLRNSEVQLS